MAVIFVSQKISVDDRQHAEIDMVQPLARSTDGGREVHENHPSSVLDVLGLLRTPFTCQLLNLQKKIVPNWEKGADDAFLYGIELA
jgi:hypothetical protein